MAEEKEKNKFKQAMWSKVNTWLEDLEGPTKKKDPDPKADTGKPNDDPWPSNI